ncbi:MAG: FecR domain-containing protein [Parvularculaceae bacterium]|nr:FecR domain-containing protein [Parvularculaceae bacterium]
MTHTEHYRVSNMSVDEQADYWVMRQMDGPLSADDERAFTEWLGHDEHRVAFELAERRDAGLSLHADELLAESFEEELMALDQQNEDRHSRMPLAAGLAACLVFTVACFTLLVDFKGPQGSVVYATNIGDTQNVALADGSVVTLSSVSEIDVTLTDDLRHVSMAQGEAFFSVAREPQRAFLIETGHGSITVTGTKFNVRTRTDKTVVSVLSGAVDVVPGGEVAFTLLAGDRLMFGPALEQAEKSRFDPSEVLAWRQGKLVFRGTPLQEVVAELNRHFPTPIVLGEDAPKDAPVDGTFPTDDPDLAIRGLTVALSLEAVERPGGVVLRTER